MSAKAAEARSSYQFQGVVTALSSISHIGDTFGINAKLRREKIIQPDGSVEQVPVFSGNAVRGLLRDLGMAYMLARLGNPKLSLAAFYFLFSGGSLSKVSGKAVDVDYARQIQQLIPLVGIFGGAVGNQILPGRLQIGKLLPICQETKHLLPERAYSGMNLASIWEYLQEEAYTRKDDEKDERKRHLLTAPEKQLLDTKRREKQAVVNTDDDVDEAVGQHQQMRYYCETFSAGVRFWWEISLADVMELEFQAFLSCLYEFSRNPVIGGKGSIGHGKVSVKFDKWLTINPHVETGEAIDAPLGTLYQHHLETRGADILRMLGEFE